MSVSDGREICPCVGAGRGEGRGATGGVEVRGTTGGVEVRGTTGGGRPPRARVGVIYTPHKSHLLF